MREMNDMQYTMADIMSEGPCEEYTIKRVEALWSGRESLSPRQIAELDIPILDRIWILGRLLYRLSLMRAHRITRLIALDVADLWPCPNIAWWYLVSGDENSRAASWDAAGDAPWDASWNAARDASIFAMDAAAASENIFWYVIKAAARIAASWDAALGRYLGWLIRFGWEV